MTDSSQPIAGWYPDPENSAAERWWDGTAWSDHRRASTVAPIPPTAPAAPAAPVTPVAAPEAPAAVSAVPVPEPSGFAAPGTSLSGAAAAPVADPNVPAASATAPSSAASAPAAAPQYASGVPAAPAAPAAYNPYGAPAYTPTAPANSLAVVGLVLALGGLILNFGGLTSLAGGIVSTLALVRASKMKARGETGHRWGMALAGTICGYVFFVLILAVTIFGISLLLSQPSSYNDFS